MHALQTGGGVGGQAVETGELCAEVALAVVVGSEREGGAAGVAEGGGGRRAGEAGSGAEQTLHSVGLIGVWQLTLCAYTIKISINIVVHTFVTVTITSIAAITMQIIPILACSACST